MLTADVLTADALVLATPDRPSECASAVALWTRRALLALLIVVGGLATLWIVSQLGPVAYGLPAPFFRRAAAVPAAA